MLPTFATRLAAMLHAVKVTRSQADLIVDLGTPAYEPYDIFAAALIPALSAIGDLNAFRSFIVMGIGSFRTPCAMVALNPEKPVNPARLVKFTNVRLEESAALAGAPGLAYGDYTIVHPAFVVGLDMRKIKPAGKLVYTSNGDWIIRKGGAFRKNPAQMHDHCNHVVKSGRFKGARVIQYRRFR